MKRFKKLIVAGLVMTLPFYTISGQHKPSEYLSRYESEYLVRLKDHCYTSITIAKGELKIERKFIKENLYLDKSAGAMGNISLEYTPPFTAIDNIEAYSLIPRTDKDDYTRKKVKDIADEQIISNDYFYEGNRAKIFSYPSLQKGAISVLEYTENVHEPKLIGSEVFQGFSVVEDQLFELRHDKEVELDIRYFNCTEDYFDYTVTESGSTIIHRWSPREYEKIREEENMPEYLRVMPHIVYRIKSYTYKDSEHPVLRNTEDLYQWYQSFVEDVNSDNNDAIYALTDSLISGKSGEIEKTRAIFQWVQGNIKYVAFEDGLGGFVPRKPADVFNKRYGDCKDMSCLLVNMLNHANVSAYHTWIGTRRLPYSYSDVPSPLADNHMIACASINGECIFLDPTGSDLPFPLPSSFIQGKEALIGVAQDSFVVKEVPIVPASQNTIYDSTCIKLEGLSLKGTGVRTYTGYYADVLNRNLHNNDRNELNDIIKYRVRKGNNKCISRNYNVDQQQSHTALDYEFEIGDYAYDSEGQIFLNLNLEKIMNDYKVKADRQYPVDYNFTSTHIRDYVLEIPEGYTTSYVPEASELTFPEFGFTIKYTQVENKLHYHLEITMDALQVEKSDFDNWNKMIKALNTNYNTSIILTKQ